MTDERFRSGLKTQREPFRQLNDISKSISGGGSADGEKKENIGTVFERIIQIDYSVRKTNFEHDALWEPFQRVINLYKSGHNCEKDITEEQVKTNSIDLKEGQESVYSVTTVKALNWGSLNAIFGFTGNLLLSNSTINAAEFLGYRNRDVTNENLKDLKIWEWKHSKRLTTFLEECAGLKEYDKRHEVTRGIIYLDERYPNVWIIRIESEKTLRPFMAAVGYV